MFLTKKTQKKSRFDLKNEKSGKKVLKILDLAVGGAQNN